MSKTPKDDENRSRDEHQKMDSELVKILVFELTLNLNLLGAMYAQLLLFKSALVQTKLFLS